MGMFMKCPKDNPSPNPQPQIPNYYLSLFRIEKFPLLASSTKVPPVPHARTLMRAVELADLGTRQLKLVTLGLSPEARSNHVDPPLVDK